MLMSALSYIETSSSRSILVGSSTRTKANCHDPGFYQILGENFRFYFACVD
jgi:hypothetical protein